MSEIFNIYCDESCHLENDRLPIMVLGAVWCPLEKRREIAVRIREIKTQHGLPPNFEIKWVKVSPAKLDFYLAVMDYFFDDDDLHFRGLIADKTRLRHKEHNQTHDDWYYKMYFDMLKVILFPNSRYRIYIDIKDTQSKSKVENLQKLHEVLSNNMYDFRREVVERVQAVHSHEVEQLQLVDLLIGTVAYANRSLQTSQAKLELVKRMRERSGYRLTSKTLYREDKVNLFLWQPNWGRDNDK
ncbi:MAG: hypothetical protein JETCAE02_01370 [Anaerolineaceae bacterium]|jgi:hypothetical protein|nr:DUF3800 domain-containing protein [Chloroflexota bacterium]MCZ7549314.1 DUF3800 domain-containing protein [Anaerolineales bacterium]MDL1926009.1 DUF3800 domain-containing protein [Anaerolineae bacterium AMX1]GER81358.1 conserved hypothetical protein [Candidatus Denitrolinea symbiosum]GJQ37725.1 MAG: hypothetical protein JETCAE02_01370 [Anaerolineaceae bacterium]